MCAKDVKYRKIEEDIIEAIKEGRLRPGDRMWEPLWRKSR